MITFLCGFGVGIVFAFIILFFIFFRNFKAWK